MKKIPYGRQFIDLDDQVAVKKTLQGDFITTGNKVIEFEKNLKIFTKSNFAVTCNSGTSALHLSFLAINLKKDDVVIMPSINFIAAFNMCQNLNAKIYLSDVDPIHGKMTPYLLERCIKKNKIKKIKAIVTMHLGGQPDYINEFFSIKKKYNCYLIEDACHALGARYKVENKIFNVGSCKHADLCTFSFHPIKSITTAEGGAITTNKKNLYKKICLLRSHGIERSKKNYHWSYDIKSIGFNYRLSDINCSLGISQLKKINKFIKKRKSIAERYLKHFKKYNKYIKIPQVNKNVYPSWHLFLISINFKKLNSNKDNFLLYLKKNKIFAQYHYIPIYRLSIAKKKYHKNKNSEIYFKNSVSLPIFYNLKDKEQKKVMNYVTNFITK